MSITQCSIRTHAGTRMDLDMDFDVFKNATVLVLEEGENTVSRYFTYSPKLSNEEDKSVFVEVVAADISEMWRLQPLFGAYKLVTKYWSGDIRVNQYILRDDLVADVTGVLGLDMNNEHHFNFCKSCRDASAKLKDWDGHGVLEIKLHDITCTLIAPAIA